jgi:DNA polymerase-3 subunit delta
MKLSFKQIEPFVQNPDSNARVIVVYGPDQGLVTERSKSMGLTIVDDLKDPFNSVILTPSQITDDPSCFFDETQAQSMMGGDRLITIKSATDSIASHIQSYLETPSENTLVIIECGDVNPRSPLRKLAEGAKNAAAVPCYIDDERNLSGIIQDMCRHAGYKIDRNALQILAAALVGDRTIARNEVEKLVLYKGYAENYNGFDDEPVRAPMGTITLDDVIACSGDIRDWSMDQLVYAIGDGNLQKCHTVLESLFRDQVVPIVVLRSVESHFWRLHSVKAKIESGDTMESACKTLSPPLFWKVQDAFKAQTNRWTLKALQQGLDILNETEAKTKQSGYDVEALVRHSFMQLCRYNPHKR